jgi:hypothetical protein
MTNPGKVKHIPGRVTATDQEILEAYKKMPFLHYIQTKYKVGIIRLRKIVREYEASKPAMTEQADGSLPHGLQ